jgi:hypothetical protein
MENKTKLYNVLINCKQNTVVAFKEIKRNEWFTGIITYIYPPKSNSDEFRISINLNVPIEPQWYDDEQTVYYLNDISDLVILE